MKYRRLGKTGIDVSVIGLGTYQYGGEWGKDFTVSEVVAILDAAKEQGINLIDTAECYGDHLAEKLVGEAIRGKREDWIIATKFGHKFLPAFGREQIWSSKDVLKQLDDSLKALKTDYVDVYMFHSPTNNELQNDEVWSLLNQQKAEGKIKHFGLSLKPALDDNVFQTNFASERGVEVIEILYNRLDRGPEAETFSLCIKNNLGVLARVPLASGLLSGKYKPGAQFISSDFRSVQDRKALDERLSLVEKIQKDEVPDGVNMPEWAIAWSLKHDAVAACIPGFKNINQMMAGIRAVELDMVPTKHPLHVK